MSSSAGVIKRLYLKNFLTYDEVQFQPKPGLNMIVGPNGSGKSSLVCGICLVLAGKPSVLGRAPHLKEFIKFGRSYAVLEIELCHPKGDVTIKRTIHANRSEWKINGEASNQETVVETVANMNIQVNNLCQFLPQDRVADFVKMTPQQLLIGTEQAIGSAMLIENHDKLKLLQKELAVVEDKIKATEVQLSKEVQLNEHLEAELVRLNDYKAAKKHLDLYEAKLAWLNYVVKRDTYLKTKDALKKETENMMAKQNVKKRHSEKVTRMERQMRELDQLKTQLELTLRRIKEKTDRTREEIDKGLERMDEIQHDFKEQLDADNERIEKEKSLRATVEWLQTKYREELDSVQQEGVEGKLKDVKARINGLNNELNQLSSKRQEKQQLATSTDQELHEVEEKYHSLVEAPDPRMEMIRRAKPHTFEACTWLDKNRNLFRGFIYKPVSVELTVPHDRAARYLEVILGADTLFSFVAENADDMELFVKETRRKGWKVNVGTAPNKPRESYAHSVPKEEIAQFGVEGYVTDLLEAPDAVFTYICELHNLHRIPYGVEALEDHIYDLRAKYHMNRAIAGNSLVNIVKSEFSTDVTRISKNINKNTILVVSTQRERIEHIRASIQQLKEKGHQLAKEHNALKEKAEDLNRIAQGVKDEERKLVQRLGANRKLKDTLDVKKAQLARLQQVPTDLAMRKKAVEKRLTNELTMFRKNTTELASDASKNLEQLQKLAKVVCRAEEMNEQFEGSRDELLQVERELTAVKASCILLETSTENTRREAVQMLDQAKSLVGLENASGRAAVQLPAEINAQFETLSNDIAEIEGYIAAETSRLTLMVPHNKNVEREYNKRKQLISNIKAVVDEHTRTLAALKADVVARDREWRSELDELVQKIDATFSKFFSLLGCGGKVTLYTGEAQHQYDRYGITIFVRFREGTELCELTPTHQSGGERSVATILYMMALQELTVVPFRVIDEINQGMDSVNERRVFEFLVKTAELNEAQYLLITPKLLTGLPYSEKMSVHFVYPNVRFTHHQWSLQKFIDRHSSQKEGSQQSRTNEASRSH